MMEQLTLPRTKKSKRSAPLCHITTEEPAKQFSEDMYADGVLFADFVLTVYRLLGVILSKIISSK